MPLEFPERVELARTPTPLEPLARTGEELGVELLVKRDDLTGAELSGNKVRKLEFLFADARARGADTVVTGGGEQSNHCRATAMAAARLGMRSTLLLRVPDPRKPPPTRGNVLLDRLAGAEVVWITPEEWSRREELFEREAVRLRRGGLSPYIIPEGGSNAVGSWGYVRCAEELSAQLAALPPKPTTVVYACGSGGTGAGLLLGKKLVGLDARLTGFAVCDDREYFVRGIGRICAEFDEAYGTGARVQPGDIDIVEDYVGAGYARSRPEELELLRDICRREGIVLDPVYTGKAMFGLCRELARDRERFGERVVFLHTGGIFGLFSATPALSPLL